MSETDPILERITVFGSWQYDSNGNIMWKKTSVKKVFNLTIHEWISSPELVEFETPEQRELRKEISTCFIFKKDIKSDDFEDTKTQFYKLPVQFKVNPAMSQNIWLRESGKVYLLSINPYNPQCIEAPHESTENVTVKKGKPVKISVAEAQRIIKSGNKNLFGKVTGSGANLDFITCV